MVAVVVATEIALSQTLPERFFSHEVDRALHRIKQAKGDAEILFIGDSVGRQLIISAAQRGWPGNKGHTLATNQVIEMAGNYYLVRRYLLRHGKPRAVVFVAGPPESVDLGQASNENFIQRCFLRWDEIAELTFYKGLRFGCVMVVHKLFPSYRYRYHIQKKLVGFSNASIYEGLKRESSGGTAAEGSDKGFQIKGTLFDTYFRKLLDMLSRESIDFYYVFPPVSQARWKKDKQRYEAMRLFLDSLRREYPLFRFRGGLRMYPDYSFKKDEIHLQGEGRALATTYLIKCLGGAQGLPRPKDGP